MTAALPFSPSVTKEIRALLPAWVATLVVVGTAAATGDPLLYGAGAVAYGLGAITIGASSIGHEYSCGTLPLLLSQPSSRARLLLAKLQVLLPMLTLLGAAGLVLTIFVAGHGGPGTHQETHRRLAALLVLPLLCGLSIAPLMTILSRSALAGVVFTAAISTFTWGIGESVGAIRYGQRSSMAGVPPFTQVVFGGGMLIICAVAGVLTWRRFARLEAIEGRDADVDLPAWVADRAPASGSPLAVGARNHHPLWLLAKKELRIQQLTFVVSALYVGAWLTLFALGRVVPDASGRGPLAGLSVLYGGMLALLIGSLASAEERHLGTLESQILLPMPSWKQWLMKTAVALALAMVFAVALPVLGSLGEIGFNRWHAVIVIVFTIGSLYVSSLSTSGLRALLVSVPTILATLYIVASLVLFLRLDVVIWRRGAHAGWISLYLVLLASFLALLLRLALENHRSGERGAMRVTKQVCLIAAYLVLGLGVLFAPAW